MQDDESAIRQLVATWATASKAGDTQTELSLMADDAVFLVPGRPPMRGKAAFAAAQTSTQPFHIEGKSDIREIKVLGNWAYLWTELTVIATPITGGDPIRRAGHTLSILRKENGKWLLARDANMLAPEPH